MATSVAAIATEAFTAVAAELPDAIKDATHRRSTVGDYDTVSGRATSTDVDTGCRLVFASVDAAQDIFPELNIGAADELAYAEGLGAVLPQKADVFLVGAEQWQVLAARDLVRAAGLHAVLLRRA